MRSKAAQSLLPHKIERFVNWYVYWDWNLTPCPWSLGLDLKRVLLFLHQIEPFASMYLYWSLTPILMNLRMNLTRAMDFQQSRMS